MNVIYRVVCLFRGHDVRRLFSHHEKAYTIVGVMCARCGKRFTNLTYTNAEYQRQQRTGEL